MRKHLIPILLLAAVTLTACAHDAPTVTGVESAALARVPDQVPFRAWLEGTTEAVRLDPTFLQSTFRGTGQATHLGRTAAEAVLLLNTDTFQFTGEMTLTGADGSQVTGTVSGQLVPQEYPLFAVVGSYTISGGTRRFAGASGEGALEGELNWETEEARLTLEGTISSVGSLRR